MEEGGGPGAAATGEPCSAGVADAPVSPDTAAARAVAIATPVAEIERVPLLEARGRVLARAVSSPLDLPPFDNSAMDGYAVRIAELDGGGPWTLRIAGRSVAGDVGDTADPGGMAAIRILTGAPVPPGFDAVVMQEHCRREGEKIVVGRMPRRHDNIRLAGEDVRRGSALGEPGQLLSPQLLALLAGAGAGTVEVFRKARIGLVSTGSELRDPGEALGPGQIYNSNRVLIRAMLAASPWARIEDFGIVPDDRRLLAEVLERAAGRCDVVVTTGGVSAGDEDHVGAILRESGASLEVLKVAMRPGKPLKVGTLGDALFAGLPGNPNAALVTFWRIALPAIRAVAGLADTQPAWHPAQAGFRYARKTGRTEFVPVRTVGRAASGAPVVEMLGRGSSASLSAMAQADGIAQLPPEAEAIEPGMAIRYEPFPGA